MRACLPRPRTSCVSLDLEKFGLAMKIEWTLLILRFIASVRQTDGWMGHDHAGCCIRGKHAYVVRLWPKYKRFQHCFVCLVIIIIIPPTPPLGGMRVLAVANKQLGQGLLTWFSNKSRWKTARLIYGNDSCFRPLDEWFPLLTPLSRQ